MKIIYNNIIPFPGFIAINICGILFARKKYKPLSDIIINHEKIHTEQMKETLFIGFYILYMFMWLFNLIFHTKTAYKSIPFEQEAYTYEKDIDYLKSRKRYNWLKFM